MASPSAASGTVIRERAYAALARTDTVEMPVQINGKMRAKFRVAQDADRAEVESLAATVTDSDGVVLVPAFTGLGAPYWDPPHPMYDPINYMPRVTQPVLMINGRHDHLFLYEHSQLRMLELLGAPAEHKKHLVFEEGHFDFPRNTVAREVSNWFDKYMGPVR